tara:strand:- start:1770 stop:2978 length:1209 start_codon:yes stop_codon:yes gene_type:complete
MAFNPLQNYMQGQQAGQGQQIQRLSGALAGEMQGGGNIQQSQNFQDLMALDPDRANKSMATFQALSKERKTALYEDMVMARTLLSRGDAGGALNIFEDRIDALGGPGEGTQDSQYYVDSIRSGNLDKTMADLGSGIEGANAIGIGSALSKGKSVQSSKMYDNGTVASVLKGGGIQVTDPSGNVVTGNDARAVVKRANAAARKSREDKARLEVDTAKSKARAGDLVAREKADIQMGLDAAQVVPIFRRAEQLLDRVETGNIESMKLAAKKFFNIEGGDAVELQNNLGQQILKQLKPIFGSQFTAREGDWLKEMEASFGRNTIVNRRLVRQGLDLASERAKIGINAADSSNDLRTVDTINGWLNWEYKDRTAAEDEITLEQVNSMGLDELRAIKAKQQTQQGNP